MKRVFDKVKEYVTFRFIDDSRKRELAIHRSFCFLGAIICPVFILLTIQYYNTLLQKAFFLSFPVLFILLLFFSYKSKQVKENIKHYLFSIYVLISFFTIYITWYNSFSFEHSFALALIFFVFSNVITDSRHIVIYFLSFFIAGIIAIALTEKPEIDIPFLIGFFIVFFVVGYFFVRFNAYTRQKLEENEKLLQTIFNQTFDAILLVDFYSRKVYDCNDAALKIFETNNKNNIIGFTRDKYQKIKLTEEEVIKCRKEINEKGIIQTETEFITEKGKEFWALVIVTPVIHNGKEFYVVRISDITLRKKAEMELIMSENRIRSLIDNANICIHEIDREGKILSINKYGLKILGASIDKDVVGKFCYDMGYEKDKPEIINYIKQAWNGNTVKYNIKTGNEKLLSTVLIPIQDNNANIVRVMGITDDITSQKKYESAILNSEKNYRELFDNSLELIYIQDENGKFIDVNKAVVEKYKMSKAEIIGNTPEIFAAPGKNNMEFVMQYIQKAWQGIPQSFDWWSITKDKHIFPKEVFLRKGNYFGKEVIIASGRDITERVKAENIIKESHNTYKDLIDNSPNGIIIQVDEIIEFTNPKAVKMLGYKKTEQLIGKNIIEILNPGQEEKYKKRKEFFNKGEPQAFMEFEIIRGDGKKSIIESIPATINYYGKPAIQIVLIDNEEKKKLDKEKLRAEVAEEANFKLQKEINERIHAEKELTDAKNFIRNIIDSSLDIICASDSNGKITEMNPAGLKMFGYNLEEIIGKNISVLFADKKNYSGVIENLFIKQGSFSGEVYNIKKNGETFISFLSASPLKNESEQIIGTMGVSRNITEIKEGERRLRESEERYRALYNQAYIGIAKVGLDGKFLEVNQQFSNITGYEHIELLQKTFIDITHPEDIDMSNNVLDKFINGKIDKISFEKRYIHKNGHTLHISVTIALVKSIKGKPDYFVSVFQDISERKEAEDALINSLKEKEILLKEIHHRVKNNLQVISSILNLQTSYVQDSKTLQILQESQNRIKSMSFIHENLYQASNFSRIDFSAYINNLSKNLLYSYQISNAHIDLILDLDKVFLDIDTAIPCGLILNELITNAIKYGFKDRNNGKLEICVKEKNKNIKIVIADDGIGLPENFNMNETNTLGLQLVNALAEQIESKLHYETSKNGTKFIISFINKN